LEIVFFVAFTCLIKYPYVFFVQQIVGRYVVRPLHLYNTGVSTNIKNTQWTNNQATKGTSWKNIPRVNISTHKNAFFYSHDDQTTAIIIIIAIIQQHQQQQQQHQSSSIIIVIIIIVLVVMEVHSLITIV